MEVFGFSENKGMSEHGAGGKSAGSISCENSVRWSDFLYISLHRGTVSIEPLSPKKWCRGGRKILGAYNRLQDFPLSNTQHSTSTGCEQLHQETKKLRWSRKPPALSCCNFALRFNSVLQHQTGNNSSTIPCSCFIAWTLNAVSHSTDFKDVSACN